MSKTLGAAAGALALCLGLALAQPTLAQSGPPGISTLHDSLHLTADQEPAWSDYVEALSPDPQASARRQSMQEMLPSLRTPRRLALIEAAMAQDAADFQRRSQAILTLYDRLSPDQQRTFDRLTLPRGAQQPAGEATPPAPQGLKTPPSP